MNKNKKGFTLAELLIVVAIIGVLVAISIPIFTSQLEKSREAVDLANLRSAYAAGCYKLMDADFDSKSKDQTYIYDPTAGKLLTIPEANNVTNSDALFCGKGTSTVGSEDNTQSITWNGTEYTDYKKISKQSAGKKGNFYSAGSKGMLYDPKEDVKGKAIAVFIYPSSNSVIAYFY
ncbi:type IV pilin protein [Bacillota bacterium HCP3S3_F1_1]